MRTADTITEAQYEQITAEYGGELDVWSVGITLPDGTYVGVSCAIEASVPSAKAQVRARCVALFNTRTEKIIQKAWTPGIGEWRFNREYGARDL